MRRRRHRVFSRRWPLPLRHSSYILFLHHSLMHNGFDVISSDPSTSTSTCLVSRPLADWLIRCVDASIFCLPVCSALPCFYCASPLPSSCLGYDPRLDFPARHRIPSLLTLHSPQKTATRCQTATSCAHGAAPQTTPHQKSSRTCPTPARRSTSGARGLCCTCWCVGVCRLRMSMRLRFIRRSSMGCVVAFVLLFCFLFCFGFLFEGEGLFVCLFVGVRTPELDTGRYALPHLAHVDRGSYQADNGPRDSVAPLDETVRLSPPPFTRHILAY